MANDDIVQTIKFEVEDPGSAFDGILPEAQKLVKSLESEFNSAISVKVDFQPVMDSAKQAAGAIQNILKQDLNTAGLDKVVKSADNIKTSADKATDALKNMNKAVATSPPSQAPETQQARVERSLAARSSPTGEELKRRQEAFASGTTFDAFGGVIGGGGGGGPPPPPKPPKPPQEGVEEAASTTEAIHTLREALHALHPAATEAGISFGELNAIMVAARGGAVALAASIGGLLTVAFEKAGDAANDAASRLGSFSGGGARGVESFEGLKKLAVQLDSTATALAKPFEQLSRINTQQGLGLSQENLQGILSTLVKGTQADRVPEAEALKGLTGILTDIRKTGIFSDSDIKALEELSPQLSQALLQSIEKIAPGQIAAGTVSAPTVLAAAQTPEFKSQIDANKKAAGQFADSISTAFDNVVSASERLAESLSGGHVIAQTLDEFAKFLQGLADRIDGLNPIGKTGVKAGAAGGALAGVVGGGIVGSAAIPVPILGTLIGAIVGGVAGGFGGGAIGGAVGEKLGDAPVSNTERLSDAFKQLSDSSAHATEATHGLTDSQKRFAESSGATQKQIAAQTAGANKQQAAVNLQFLRPEQESQTAHDELGVEKAGLAQQQAAIGVVEAHKQLELAALSTAQAMVAAGDAAKQMALAQLAPQQAAVALASAQNNLATIQDQNQLRRLKDAGADVSDTTEDPDVLRVKQRLKQDQDKAADIAEQQAAIAVKVAEVNLRYADLEVPKAELAQKRAAIELQYSYLDEPKAALAAKQAEIAVKSAAIEESDAKLKLAKDSAGQPIARDLAALNYAQASLDEFIKHTELQENLKTLPEILKAIENLGKGGGDKKESEQQQRGDTSGGAGAGSGYAGEGRYGATSRTGFETPEQLRQLGPIPLQGREITGRQVSDASDAMTSPTQAMVNKVDEMLQRQNVPSQRSDATPSLEEAGTAATQLASAFTELTTATTTTTQAETEAADKTKPLQSDIITQPLEDTGTAFDTTKTAADTLTTALDGLTTKLQQAGTPSGATTAAGGGYITGPGTGTSDSIAAWLSHGEFVQSARATAFWGADFMHALNNLQTPRFSVGGLAGLFSPQMPRFAAGGMVSGGGVPHLGTVDLRTDHGSVTMLASNSAVDQLGRLAVQKRMTSTGRKPGFIG